MFNSNDIYSHLIHGGSIEELHKALSNEIQDAQNRINREKTAAEQKIKARTAAFKALKLYLALVSPDVTEDMINLTLDALETVRKVEIDVTKNNEKIELLEKIFPFWI